MRALSPKRGKRDPRCFSSELAERLKKTTMLVGQGVRGSRIGHLVAECQTILAILIRQKEPPRGVYIQQSNAEISVRLLEFAVMIKKQL
jgi:hypothetical protein